MQLLVHSDSEIVFPKIFVCSHSQHSLAKLHRHYPGISKEWIRIFYGGFQKIDGRTAAMSPEMARYALRLDDTSIWNQLKSIDLKEFFKKTRPTYRLMGCDLNYKVQLKIV